MNINSVVLGGHVSKAPDLKFTNSNKDPVSNFTVASNRSFTSAGVKKEESIFVSVVCWGHLARVCSQYLKKGSGVIVEGRIIQDKWTDQGQERSKTRICASRVHFVTQAKASEGERR